MRKIAEPSSLSQRSLPGEAGEKWRDTDYGMQNLYVTWLLHVLFLWGCGYNFTSNGFIKTNDYQKHNIVCHPSGNIYFLTIQGLFSEIIVDEITVKSPYEFCRRLFRVTLAGSPLSDLLRGPLGDSLAATSLILITPNLPTKIIPTKIAWLKLSGKYPMGMVIPPLNVRIMIESNPLKSRILVWRLAVVILHCVAGIRNASCHWRRYRVHRKLQSLLDWQIRNIVYIEQSPNHRHWNLFWRTHSNTCWLLFRYRSVVMKLVWVRA